MHPRSNRLRACALAAALCAMTWAHAGGRASAEMASSDEADQITQMVVKLRPGAAPALAGALGRSAAEHGVKLAKLRDMALGASVFKLDKKLSRAAAAQLARQLSSLPGVEYAEADLPVFPLMVPNDPLYSSQWHYSEPAGGINVQPAWDLSTGAGITVGVIDTGYRPHADLVDNIVPGYDFISSSARARDGNGRDANAQDEGDWGKLLRIIPIDSSWHGTHVAGTIAAKTNNNIGVAGVAFGAKVMPVRVLGKGGGTDSDVADAVVWASGGTVAGIPKTTTPARVLNLSLGGKGACTTSMQQAIDGAVSRGTVVVVAAGNSSEDAGQYQPASCRGIVTVAAVGREGGRASYSNFGSVVEIAAPGGDGPDFVMSTLNAGKKKPGADSYGGADYMGTSMAAPHVAGVVALMLSKNPALTPAQVTTLLQSTARPFPASCVQCGAGIVDAAAAVAAAAP